MFMRDILIDLSIFNINKSELKVILQNPKVVKAPVKAIPGGQYKRTVDTGQVVGNTTLKQGGKPTT